VETLTAADGRTLAYRSVGSGPPLVCHPGGPGFSSAELDDLGGLSATRTLVLLDPRATGGSDPAAGYELEGYVDDVDVLRGHLGLAQLDLLGFSHGGIVAMAYAAAHPERVRRLVLASTLAAVSPDVEEEMARIKATKSDEPWFADAEAALEEEERGDYDDVGELWKRMAPLYFSRWDERHRPWLERSAAGASPEPLRAFNETSFDLRPDLGRITAPTLVITGRDDFICGPAAAAELAAGVARAEVVLLDGSGHMTFVERPDAFRDAVERFLAG
jgi:pimeloyl-ACP methyl ester carboxylesterase